MFKAGILDQQLKKFFERAIELLKPRVLKEGWATAAQGNVHSKRCCWLAINGVWEAVRFINAKATYIIL